MIQFFVLISEMKPRMSFIPRVVQKNALNDSSAPPKSVTKGSTNGNPITSSSLQTNDDFRKFLTQSK